MNRELAHSVVEGFRTENAELIERDLNKFRERDWMDTGKWLHTSGLALYLWDRLTTMGIAEVVPQEFARQLQMSVAENKARTADLFDEFASINTAFQRSEILYANLKGFTLVPVACSDPALRYQHDLDFLVARRDGERCRAVLVRHGYVQTAGAGDTWEFRAGEAEVCTMRQLYRVRKQRSLEVHLVPDAEGKSPEGCLARLQLQMWNGFEFPALSECDKFLAQAMHLFKHFQTEWTRTAWLLEYARAIAWHRDDSHLWREVELAVAATPAMRIGVGMASLIASRRFRAKLPTAIARAVDAMPPRVRVWTDQYEERLVFTEHPGSKLYLFLKDVLLEGAPEWQLQRRRSLLPRSLPPQVVVAKSGGVWMGLRIRAGQLRFVGQRLWFHIASGLRYRMEETRWRRVLAGVRP